MSWKNAHVPTVDESQTIFPFMQWINNGSSLDPRHPRGGFGQPEEQVELAGDYPRGAKMHNFILKSGKSVLMTFTPTIRASVLATRFAWIQDGRRIPDYVQGARSKLQALALVEGEAGSFLTVLTFTGLAGKEFSGALKKHRERIRKLTRAAGQDAPASIFYATYTAGEPKMVGRTAKSNITPVALSDNDDYNLSTAYVGDEALASVDWDQVKAWKEAWKAPGPNGEGVVEENEDNASPEEGTLEWARKFPLPFSGRTVKAGTPLGDLDDDALSFIAKKMQAKYPKAAKAARRLLQKAETKIPF